MSTVTTDSLLTKEQACVYLQVSTPTLDRWVRLGKLTSIKIGRTVRFSKESLTSQDIPEVVSQKGGLK